MKTLLHKEHANTAYGLEAESILRSCVHCGFCNATCPTYLELGDERDGPRGRIYLIKQMLETNKISQHSLTHLDRCLSCRSCETTCPSSVQYGRLVDIGRNIAESKIKRSLKLRFLRLVLRKILPYRNRFTLLLRLGQCIRPLLPAHLKARIPLRSNTGLIPAVREQREMLLLAGCVQPGATPRTNSAAIRVLAKLGISLIEEQKAGCCGAVSYHLAAHEESLDFMRRNIDAWWPAIETGAQAIVVSASGCGAMIREYGYLFRHDPRYADKAKRISTMTMDLSEVLIREDIHRLKLPADKGKIAVHSPCTLQHGLGLHDNIEKILQRVGIKLAKTNDNHLCCGSAGTYSLLQPTLSNNLLENKVAALSIDNPDCIVTANVGCQLHISSKAAVPVHHWIELLDDQTVNPL
jgi:glycolate oxidase iron-sulfur subunit